MFRTTGTSSCAVKLGEIVVLLRYCDRCFRVCSVSELSNVVPPSMLHVLCVAYPVCTVEVVYGGELHRIHSTWWWPEQTKTYTTARNLRKDLILNLYGPPDRLCGLMVRSRGPGWIPGATRFSEKQWVWNRVHSALWVQLRGYLEEKVTAPV
jgi:hypothetical protein